MCRLFGMSGGTTRIQATFWLIEAPDSLAVQSRREPDGTGLGFYDPDGSPVVHRCPLAAYEDRVFAQEAREVVSSTFVAHVRFASIGGLTPENTHPFQQGGRLFAHNGIVEDLPSLEAKLGRYASLVAGETDSERLFALITKEIDERGGDVGAGIAAATSWVAGNLPIYSLNMVLATPSELWALRYPEVHELFLLERPAGGHHGERHLDAASAGGTVRVRSGHLMRAPSVIVASERMDENPRWRALEPGELIHVGPDLVPRSIVAIDRPPASQLRLADLHPRAAASQLHGSGDPAEPAASHPTGDV